MPGTTPAWVLDEDEALELLAYLVTAARTQVDEAAEYGPLRLLTAAVRLSERIAPRSPCWPARAASGKSTSRVSTSCAGRSPPTSPPDGRRTGSGRRDRQRPGRRPPAGAGRGRARGDPQPPGGAGDDGGTGSPRGAGNPPRRRSLGAHRGQPAP